MDAALDARLVDWIAAAAGGKIARLERALARREAWLVDVERPGEPPLELFLRIAHAGDPANSRAALEKESRVVRALAGAGVPVPAVIAIEPQTHAVLFERVAGRTDLHATEPEQQDAVYRHYLEILAALHGLDPARLDLGGLAPPADALACAMAEVDALAAGIAGLGPQPLARFGALWLRRHAPARLERIALLHGDAGIANFLFAGTRVTAAIDWEWAHLGDPMEDLGSLCIHASFSPSGEWPALLPHYERASGIRVELEKVFYYRVHNLARSVLALAPICARIHPRDPAALNLCFALQCDRMLCEAIAEATGVELERPAVPEPPDATTLYDVVVENLRHDVAPQVEGAFASDRLRSAVLLVETLARRHELGAWWENEDLAELEALLGHRPADLRSGTAALDAAIARDDGRREAEFLRALARMAFRAESIAAPVVSLFPGVRLRPIA